MTTQKQPSSYEQFVAQKRLEAPAVGFEVDGSRFAKLYDFQRDITDWALKRGRAAIFADCGLGKTPMQLKWAEAVSEETALPILIVAPLAVSEQTLREAAKFDVAPARVCASQDDVGDGINITNYEKLHHFDPDAFGGVVIDESSILKSYDGKTKQAIVDFAEPINYRLACTATPAPNDYTEILNHAEFLGVMSEKEAKALWFTQDGNSTTSWRLKGHAQEDFWKWVASWCVALRDPSDVGCEKGDFDLPPLHIKKNTVDAGWKPDGMLFGSEAVGIQQQREARRQSLNERVQKAADLANGSDEPWIIWCGLNKESKAVADAIPDAVEITGSDSSQHKRDSMLAFSRGDIRVIVTKPSIAGFGMNWQHCADTGFVGLNDSFEQVYQAIRRFWRFGQTKPVNVHFIAAETEGAVVANIRRKEADAERMAKAMVQHMADLSSAEVRGTTRDRPDYQPTQPVKLPPFLEAA